MSFVVVVNFVVVFSLYCFTALVIGFWAITYVIFAVLFVGFYHPRYRVLGFTM